MALIFVLMSLVALGYVIPRQGTARAGRLALESPELASLLATLGLDDIFGSAVFAVVLALVLVAAAAAMVHQARIVWRRTFRHAVPRSQTTFTTDRPPAEVVAAVRSHRYLFAGTVLGHGHYLRQPWGLWGGLLLHVGLVVALGAGVLVIGTERRAVADLAVGEVLEPQGMWLYEAGGRLSSPLVLDAPLALESTDPTFWPNDELRQILSVLVIFEDAAEETVTIEVNRPVRRGGLVYYQDQAVGHTFLLEVARDGVAERIRADVPWPPDRATSSHADVALETGAVLQLRSSLDDSAVSMIGVPAVVVRHALGEERSEVATLTVGVPVMVGPVSVTLVDTLRWTRIIVVRNHGIGVLFAGFFMIFFGSVLIYMTAPREVYVAGSETETVVIWRAFRFRESVIEEYETLRQELQGRER
ncbi:MAG: cytochrome c biogenesis protein ResB [Coriobacteriia bacterium]|nr:cytochrome c biogenesis protein ResB [Coriobacteriia bacterium]